MIFFLSGRITKDYISSFFISLFTEGGPTTSDFSPPDSVYRVTAHSLQVLDRMKFIFIMIAVYKAQQANDASFKHIHHIQHI